MAITSSLSTARNNNRLDVHVSSSTFFKYKKNKKQNLNFIFFFSFLFRSLMVPLCESLPVTSNRQFDVQLSDEEGEKKYKKNI